MLRVGAIGIDSAKLPQYAPLQLMMSSQRPARVTSTIPASRASSTMSIRAVRSLHSMHSMIHSTHSIRETQSGVNRLPATQLSSRTPRGSGVAFSRRSRMPATATAASGSDATGTTGMNSAGGPSTIWTIPTILTLLRVVAIPLLVASWFSGQWMWCFSLFVGASVTDFFDGYLARKWDCSTPFGAFLDPVADKLMVATILILIGTVPVPGGYFTGNAWLLPAVSCVIIAREITMSALREWAAALGPEAHAAAAVNKLGKYKTTSQMVSLVLLLGAKTGACWSGVK